MVYSNYVPSLFKFVLGIFLFFSLSCFSQNDLKPTIDSLEKKLSSLTGVAKVKALDDLCYYTSTSNIGQSIKYGNEACELAKTLGDSLLWASCLNDLSLSYYFKGTFDSCIILAEKAYNIRLAKKQWRDAGASMSKVALGYYEKGKYDISLEKNLKALELFKKAGSTAEVFKLENNIGSIYERNNQLEEAKRMYNSSAEGAISVKDYDGYVSAKCNYAIILSKTNQVKEAVAIYDELLPLSKKYCREEFISQIYQSLGVCERRLGNTEKGLEYYLLAKGIYDRIGTLSGMSIINTNIGLCYIDLKNYKEAEDYLKLGLKQSEEIKSWLWQKKAYLGLYTLEHHKGNFKQANYYLEMHQVVNDSLYNQETQDKLGQLQTQYDLQQKENTILSQQNTIAQNELELSKRNILLIIIISGFVILLFIILFVIQRNNLNRKKEEILFQNKIQKERSRISKDLHDNMGAELTIISSSIDVKAYGIEKEQDKKDLEVISDQLRQASALMRDTIWTISLEKISLTQFGLKMKEFADRVFSSRNVTVHFQNTNSELNLRPEATLNLFRIVQEIINNSVKHSGAKNFYIQNCVTNEREIVLEDDGKGFDLEKVERGYGLNNITQRASELGAKVNFEIDKGQYTRVKISISDDSIWNT
jgi:signal transduction histidine kinase